jgi:CDP-diacylglycerol--serine O-phosphatidyltransferase
MVLPVFVVVVLCFALLLSYPWEILTIGTLGYLASLPFGWLSYREQERKAEGTAGASPAPSLQSAASSEGLLSSPQGRVDDDPDKDHPPRH